MYNFNTEIISPFCDNQYYLAPEYCFHYIQEVAGRHAMSKDLGIPSLIKQDKSWVLLSTHLDFKRKVYWQTPVTITTWALPPQGIICPRKTVCKDDKGQVVFEADSIWAIVGIENGNHRIIRPNNITDALGYDSDGNDTIHPRLKKFDMDSFENVVSKKQRVVYTDCDINNHVNNLKYSSWMIGALPKEAYEGEKDVVEMDILFSHEVYVDDIVDIKMHRNGDEYHCSVDDASFAHIKMGKVEK